MDHTKTSLDCDNVYQRQDPKIDVVLPYVNKPTKIASLLISIVVTPVVVLQFFHKLETTSV